MSWPRSSTPLFAFSEFRLQFLACREVPRPELPLLLLAGRARTLFPCSRQVARGQAAPVSRKSSPENTARDNTRFKVGAVIRLCAPTGPDSLPGALDRFLPLGLEVLLAVTLQSLWSGKIQSGRPCGLFCLGCQYWAGEIARPD